MDDRLAARLELAELSHEEFVRRAYRLVLRRDPEPEAFARDVSRATLLAELVASEEFDELRALDDAIGRALAAGAPARFLEAPLGTGERAIEIPWALSRLGGAARVLDVGSANARPAYLAALIAARVPELVGVDLVEAEIPGMRTVVADVRDLPFGDSSFDLVLCVSTLEHVGHDNRVYGTTDEREGGELEALRELRRVAARGGRIVVTVPCGEEEDHEWFVQREPDGWNGLFLEAGLQVEEEEIYALGPEGWRAAADFDPRGVRYGERRATAVLCATLAPAGAMRLAVRRARAAGRRRAGGAPG
ncbi:MAG TPA: class I SAM-dependent methyltransferase [Gaiellaceae bacterium]